MKIFVTGGAGYIGSHVARGLRRRGHEVVVFDDLSTGHQEAAAEFTLLQGSLLDPAAVSAALEESRAEMVMHFAAKADVSESVEKPLLYYQNNVQGGLNLLEAMRSQGLRRIVFSSTAAVYGTAKTTPITEDHPLLPINPYGDSKLMFERILEDLHRSNALDFVALRYFNAAGADAAGDLGESHEPETHLIPRLLQEVSRAKRENRPAIATVYGNKHETPDGTCIRDYVHVSDIAEAHLLALDLLQRKSCGEAFNIGSEKGFSVLEVVRAVSAATGFEMQPKFEDARLGDPPILVASQKKARQQLGFQPKHPGLGTILSSAWAYEQRRTK